MKTCCFLLYITEATRCQGNHFFFFLIAADAIETICTGQRCSNRDCSNFKPAFFTVNMEHHAHTVRRLYYWNYLYLPTRLSYVFSRHYVKLPNGVNISGLQPSPFGLIKCARCYQRASRAIYNDHNNFGTHFAFRWTDL